MVQLGLGQFVFANDVGVPFAFLKRNTLSEQNCLI